MNFRFLLHAFACANTNLLKVNIQIKDMIVWLNIQWLSISKPFYISNNWSDNAVMTGPRQQGEWETYDIH
jgi:hypothetical protein